MKKIFTKLTTLLIALTLSTSLMAADQIVTSNADDGGGELTTLREAIAAAVDGEDITFNLTSGSETIEILSELEITKSLTIDGTNSLGSGTSVTVQVDNPSHSLYRVFNINASSSFINISNMTIKGGDISGNGETPSGFGGGVYLAVGDLTMENVTITNSIAFRGGAVYSTSSTQLTLNECTIDNNTVSNDGGGLYISGGGNEVEITASTISNNSTTSAKGGGICIVSGAYATINNSTIYGNTAENYGGGGIFIDDANTDVTINFCSIVANSVISGSTTLHGGGISAYGGTLTIQNTLLGNNTADQGDDFYKNSGTINDNGYNIVESSVGYTWVGTGDITGSQLNLFGTGKSTQTLADNGGPTQTLAIESGSVAISAGSGNAIITDQRGNLRHDTPTNGAYEPFYPGYWTGTINTNWNTTTNWEDSSLPTSSNDVFIRPNSHAEVTNQPTISTTNQACNDLTIESGAILTVSTSRTLTVSGSSNNSGTISVSTGTFDANGTFNATGGNVTFTDAGFLNLGGIVTSLGTFTKSTSTVTYDGNTQTVAGGGGGVNEYYNLVLEGAGAKSAYDDIYVTGAFTNTQAFTINKDGEVVKGLTVMLTSTIGANITTSAGQLYTGVVTITDDVTLEALVNRITFKDRIEGTSADNLTLTASDNEGIKGSVELENTVGAGGEINNLTITSMGDSDIYGDITTSGYQTFNGRVYLRAVSGTNTFNSTSNGNITFDDIRGSGAAENLTVNAGSGTVTVNDDIGTFISIGTLTKLGDGNFKITGYRDITATGLTISAGTFNNDGDATGDWDINGDVVIASGTTIKPTSGTFSVGGNWTNNGTASAALGTVVFNGSDTQSITGTNTFNNFTVTNTHASNYVDASTSTLIVGGTLNITDGKLKSASDYNNVTIGAGGTLELTSNITVSGNWSNSGTFTHSNKLVTFDGGADNTTITGTTEFYDVTVNKDELADLITMSSGTFDVNNILTVTEGTLSVLNLDVETGTTFGAGKLQVSGTSIDFGTTFTKGTGTVEYNGGNQTIQALNYATLALSSTIADATKTFANGNDINSTTVDNEILLTDSDITTSMNLTGSSATDVTVQVPLPGVTASRVFNIDAFGETVNISNITIKGGDISGESSSASYGGGIRVDAGTLNLNDVTVSGSKAQRGGGIRNEGTLTITDAIISGNTASDGGGIYNATSAILTVTNSTVSGNTATVEDGGGIYSSESSDLTVTNSTISSNTATLDGGGIDLYKCNATITGSTFSGNDASDDGGGIYIYESTATITGGTFSGNDASDAGGGIYTSSSSDLTVTNSTINGNTANDDGGGIYNSSDCTLNLTNCTVSSNMADDKGGGLYSRGTVNITVSTFAYNHSDNDISSSPESLGGGIYLSGESLTVKNTIIANNYSGSSTSVGNDYRYDDGTLADNGYNVIEYQSGSTTGDDKTFTASSNFIYTGSDSDWNHNGGTQSGLLSLSLSLADNGGQTETLAITDSESIAIGNGNTTELFDQRDFLRGMNGGTTIGAYEYGSGAPANGLYMSVATGNWTDVNTWEVYNSTSEEWESATVKPGASDDVVISIGDNVTVDGNEASNTLTVTSSGTLTVATNNSLTASGATDVSGTLSIAGTGLYDANSSFDATGGNVTFTDAGNLNLGSTVTSLGTFTAGTSTVTYDGTTQTIATDITYNTLALSGSSGTKTANGTLTASTLTVNGGAYNVSILGDAVISNEVTFYNTGTLTLGDGGTESLAFNGGLFTSIPSHITIGASAITSASASILKFGDSNTLVSFTKSCTIGGAGIGYLNLYGSITLSDAANLTVGTGIGNQIRIGGVSGTSGGTSNLTINTTGDVNITNNIGTGIGTVTITQAGQVDLANVSTSGSIAVSGSNIDLNGSTYSSTGGAITFTGAVDLESTGTVTISATGGDDTDDITFSSTIDDTGSNSDLVVTTGTTGLGDIAFGGVIGFTNALGSLEVDSGSRLDILNIGKTAATGVLGNTTIDAGSEVRFYGTTYHTSQFVCNGASATYGGSLTFDTDGSDITFNQQIKLRNEDNLVVNSEAGTITFVHNILSKENSSSVSLTSDANIIVNKIYGSGGEIENLILNAGLTLSLGNYITTEANEYIDIDCATLTQNAGAVITADGLIDIDVENSFTTTENISSGGTTNITVTGEDKMFTLTSGDVISSTDGTLTIAADKVDLGGTMVATDQRVILKPYTLSKTIDMGSSTDIGFALSNTEFGNISASILEVGSTSAGAITVTTGGITSGPSVMHLKTSTGITDDNNGYISGTSRTLAINAAESVSLDNATTDIDVLAVNNAGQAVTFTETDGFTVGSVDAIDGITCGTLVLTSTGNTITVANTSAANDIDVTGNLTVDGTLNNSGTITVAGSTTTLSNTTINSGGVLSCNGTDQAVNISGNWTNNGTFTQGSSTVTFNGSLAQTISGATTFYNLTIAKTNESDEVTSSGTLAVSNNLSVTKGIFISASDYADVTIASDGTLELSDNITVSGNWTNYGTFTHNNHTVTFDGTASGKTITANNSSGAFYDIAFTGTNGEWNLQDNLMVHNVFSVTNGAFVSEVNIVTIQGTNASYNATNIAAANTTWAGGTLNIQSDLDQTLPTNEVYNNLQLGRYSGTGTTVYDLLDSNPTITGTTTVDADAKILLTVTATGINKTYDGNTDATVTLSNNLISGFYDDVTNTYTTATFDNANVGTGITVSVSGISISGPDAVKYQIASTTASTTADITAKDLDITADDFSKVTGTTLTFAGTEFTSSGLVGSDNITSVSLASAGAASSAPAATYDVVPSNAQGTGLSNYSITYYNGTLTVADYVYYKTNLTGNWNWSTIENWLFSVDGSTNWTTATIQPAYDNAETITILNGTTISVDSDISIDQTVVDVGGSIIIPTGTTLEIMDGSGVDLTAEGSLDINGTISIGTATVDANGTFDATGGAVTFTDAGNLNLGSTVTSLGTFTAGTSTLTFDGGTQTIPGLTYYNLATSGSSTTTLGGAVTVENNLTSSGTSLTIDSDAVNNGSLIVSGTSIGNITYNRYMTGVDRWHLIASPVGGQDIYDFVVTDVATNAVATNGENYGLAPYNNITPDWEHYTTSTIGSAGDFIAGKGYEILRTNDGTVSFTGTVATSAVNIGITSPSAGNPWNLVGNPYPSALCANATADATNNLVSINAAVLGADAYQAIYVWDANASTPAYITVNHSLAATYIAPGQSFFVNSLNESGSSFQFTQAMQTHQTGDIFRSVTNDNITIKLIAERSEGTSSTNIKYFENTTTGLDPGYDAGRFNAGNNSFAVYTHLVESNQSSVNFDIQCLPANEFDQIIPVGLNSPENTEVVFHTEIENLPAGMFIYLEDRLTGEFTPLHETGSSYSVQLIEPSQGIGRFYLHTQSTTTGIPTDTKPEFAIIPRPKYNSIRIIGKVDNNTQVAMYDITGRLLSINKLINPETNDINMTGLNNGVYIIAIISATQRTSIKISWVKYR